MLQLREYDPEETFEGVAQRVHGLEGERAGGDCFSACLASALGLTLDELPDIIRITAGNTLGPANDFLRPRGLALRRFQFEPRDEDGSRVPVGPLPEGWWILGVGFTDTPMSGHVVLCHGPNVVWDPTPNSPNTQPTAGLLAAGRAYPRQGFELVPLDGLLDVSPV